MKKKIVVKFAVNDEKSRTKALKISVGISGVESAALTGKDMDMVVVVGENIDAVALTRQLRKSLGFTDLLSVGEDKKENKLVATPPSQQTVAWPLARQWTGYPVYYEPVVAPQDPNCTIM